MNRFLESSNLSLLDNDSHPISAFRREYGSHYNKYQYEALCGKYQREFENSKYNPEVRVSIQIDNPANDNYRMEKMTTLVERSLDDIRTILDNLVNHFEDIHQRLASFVRLKYSLNTIEDTASLTSDKYRMRCAMAIHDAIHRCWAENLTQAHLSIIIQVVGILLKQQVDKADFIKIDRILRKTDIDWLPRKDMGISE